METIKEPDVFKAMKAQMKMDSVLEMLAGENRIEGLSAFAEKRKPQWKSSL